MLFRSINPNRIAPFSEGRLNLYTGRSNVTVGTTAGFNFPPYLYNPAQVYGTSPRTPVAAGVKLLGGTSYNVQRGLFIVVRDADGAGGAPFQAGGNASKVQDLFYSTVPGAVPFAKGDAGQVAIAAGGVTPTYVVCPQTGSC